MRFNLAQTSGSTGYETPLGLNSKTYILQNGKCFFNPFHDILSNGDAIVNDLYHHCDIQNQIYTKEDQVVHGVQRLT